MTEKEFKAQMERIYAYNRRQKERERKLSDLRGLLPPPGKVPTVKEFVELLRKFREILEAL